MEKIIGILGGMGPEATADLFLKIIKATPAKRDQDHLRIIIDNNPKIPPRTESILGEGSSSLPKMVKTAKNLENAGVDFIIISCNTAHYYYEELRKSVKIPILNMIDQTVQRINKDYPKIKKIGLIATIGTIKTKIYDRGLAKTGIEIITPHENVEKKVIKAIFKYIKVGKLKEGRKLMIEVADHLVKMGAQSILCGCTEVSLVLKDGDLSVPVIDPLQILAEIAVEKAFEEKLNIVRQK